MPAKFAARQPSSLGRGKHEGSGLVYQIQPICFELTIFLQSIYFLESERYGKSCSTCRLQYIPCGLDHHFVKSYIFHLNYKSLILH